MPEWIIVAVCLPVDDIIDVPCFTVAQHEAWQGDDESEMVNDYVDLC